MALSSGDVSTNIDANKTANLKRIFEKYRTHEDQDDIKPEVVLYRAAGGFIDPRTGETISSKSDVEILSDLVKDINAQDDDPNSKRTALHYAAIKKNWTIYDLLVSKGAKTDIEDAKGKTAWDYLIPYPPLHCYTIAPPPSPIVKIKVTLEDVLEELKKSGISPNENVHADLSAESKLNADHPLQTPTSSVSPGPMLPPSKPAATSSPSAAMPAAAASPSADASEASVDGVVISSADKKSNADDHQIDELIDKFFDGHPKLNEITTGKTKEMTKNLLASLNAISVSHFVPITYLQQSQLKASACSGPAEGNVIQPSVASVNASGKANANVTK